MNARWVARVAASALIRRVVFLLVAAVVAYFSIGQAHAGVTSQSFPSREAAYASCETSRSLVEGYTSNQRTWCEYRPDLFHSAGDAAYVCVREVSTGGPDYGCGSGSHPSAVTNSYFDYNGNDGCPTGSTWNEDTGSCYTAPTDEECLAINSQSGFVGVGETTRNFTTKCMANGCMFGPVGQTAVVSVSGTPVSYTGQYEWTGACATPPPPEAPEPEAVNADNTAPQYCVPNTVPQMCIKNNGEHCVAATTGKQLCWRPGETGTKTTGDTAQKRVPGTQPATPPTPPEGETFTQGDSVTATTTKGGTATTTTTTNFKTGGGTEAGTVDQGEPDDGSGGSDQEGDDEEPGSVTGGEGCEEPPAVQGDALLANIILQTWGTRCAAIDANAVTSSGEIGDCSSPWTIEGPAGDANVQKLKAARAEICGDDANADGQPDWTEGDAPGVPGEGEPGDEVGPPAALTVGTDFLDMGGLLGGGATCPQLGVLDFGPFGTFDLNSEPVWCDLVTLMRAIVLLMAAFTAVKILMGGN